MPISRTVRSLSSLLVGASFAALLTGCVQPIGPACDEDIDCSGSQVCARTSECVPSDQLLDVRLSWTFYGQPASDNTCGSLAISALRVTFEDAFTGDNRSYEPVVCETGQVYFNKMPARFGSVLVTVLNGNRRLDSTRVWLDTRATEASIDFTP